MPRAAVDLTPLFVPRGVAVGTLQGRLGPGPLLVQEEVPLGLELLVGGRRDPSFGPMVLVGLGGGLAELLRDVSIGLAPLAPGTARAMLGEGRRAALLRGFAGPHPSTKAHWPPSSSGSGTSSRTTRRSWSWT